MNKHLLSLLAASLMAVATWTTASAMPAYPRPVKVTQPDGTQVTVLLRGDEHLNWAETTDGYTLLRDAEGFWTIAQQASDGQLQASALRFDGTTTQAQALGIARHMAFPASQRASLLKKSAAQTDLMIDGTFPSTGKRKLLVLLVNFSDTKTTYTHDDFQRMMNEKGYGGIGSFRDYYLEQSGGLLDIDVTVTDWLQLNKAKATYGPDGAAYIIYDALSMICDTLDLSQFDNDGDGVLDGLAVIHQGTGQEMSGSTDDIWSHSAAIAGMKVGGVTVKRYTIEPEQFATEDGRQAEIGVICHEFGHALGAPDYYDTDYANSGGEFCGTGQWDLLGGGAWLGSLGDRPSGINGWQKWVFGWNEAITLDADTTVSALPSANVRPVGYRFETGTEGEYFFLENRQQDGVFDQSLPGHGLIVYHVDENKIKAGLVNNDINTTYEQGIYTVDASAGQDPTSEVASFGDINTAAAPFPGTGGHSAFSDNTLPSTHSRDGRFAYRALQDISEENGQISFRFVRDTEPKKPELLSATTDEGEVFLSWSMPADTEGVDHFTVYRDGEEIGTATTESYTDLTTGEGELYTYKVDAVYTSGLTSRPSSTQIMVPTNRLTALTGSVNGGDVTLSWTTNDVLQWMNTSKGSLDTDLHSASELEYAIHFTAEDLKTYVGGKITRMAFLPLQGPSTMTVKFRVYEGKDDGTPLHLLSERNVKEFANSQPRDLKLTKAVTIEEGKDYWAAVACTSTTGEIELGYDRTTIVEGRGIVLLVDSLPQKDNIASGNVYLTMTVTAPTSGSDLTDATLKAEPDPAADFYFPQGFAIYCDGELVARTTARQQTLFNPVVGSHTYTVKSLFAGGNTSTGLSTTITIDAAGINDIEQIGATVRGGEGAVEVYGFSGDVSVSDLSGRSVARTTADGSASLQLQKGIYLVSLTEGGARSTVKVAVK